MQETVLPEQCVFFTKVDNDKASSGTKVYVPRTKAP